ncbi:hypothetical protein C5167_019117 [Papaver somniferum]|uniref:Uncharacterized protein n=1 Tax=Papaver somniferum TaxID=3469 RepID=A0A4Y7IT71_PAPSO|nr:hypothetical protein C5167_019117 [Papaver somniferum]
MGAMCFYKTKAEPEDYNAGMSLYGDKEKNKTYEARFESYDGYVNLDLQFLVPQLIVPYNDV